MNKERPDLCRLGLWIEFRRIARRKLIAAKQRLPFAPAAAPN